MVFLEQEKELMHLNSFEESMDYNLLEVGVVDVSYQGDVQRLSLPEVYAALSKDEVDDFVEIRPYQRHFWHATLCQIGAIAMVNAGVVEVPSSPEIWREMLRDLTSDAFPEDEPWCLCVSDLTKPAFMQPGATSRDKESDYKTHVDTPDELDLLQASKWHDVKDKSIQHATPGHWLYALVARQTGGGFDGNRLYGISRMNGGLGNRHGFSMTPSMRYGPHVSRDMKILARHHRGEAVGKHLLLWLEAWDGTSGEAIVLGRHVPQSQWPLYVDISRRIRLHVDGRGNIRGRRATSRTERTNAKSLKGLTQDPWAVTRPDRVVTVASAGFDYRQITSYLDSEECTLPLLAKHDRSVDGDAPMYWVARTLVRGQGKTEGYHEKVILLHPKFVRTFIGNRVQLGQIAKDRVKIIGDVQSILSHAVKTYLQGGDDKGKTKPEHKGIVGASSQRLVQAMDVSFWAHLQDELDVSETQQKSVRDEWCHNIVVKQASSILEDALRSGLSPHKEQWKAIAESRALFYRRVRGSSVLPEMNRRNENEQ